MSMPDHTDDPVAAAGGKVASYLSLATVAAEAIAQLAAARARERAVSDERIAAALGAERAAALDAGGLGGAVRAVGIFGRRAGQVLVAQRRGGLQGRGAD